MLLLVCEWGGNDSEAETTPGELEWCWKGKSEMYRNSSAMESRGGLGTCPPARLPMLYPAFLAGGPGGQSSLV